MQRSKIDLVTFGRPFIYNPVSRRSHYSLEYYCARFCGIDRVSARGSADPRYLRTLLSG